MCVSFDKNWLSFCWRSASSPRPQKSTRKQFMMLSIMRSRYSLVAKFDASAFRSSSWCCRTIRAYEGEAVGRGSNFAVKCTAVRNVFLCLFWVHFTVLENIQPFNPDRMPTSESLRNLCDPVSVRGGNNHLKYESHLSGRKVPSVSEGWNDESATPRFWSAWTIPMYATFPSAPPIS